ncbi:MAG: hypothetical protein Q9159_005964 [Coniocarpon cinnabarinum]
MGTQQYRLKGLTGLPVAEGQMQEAEVEGIEGGAVLLLNSQGKTHAVSPKCTHYGAPLKNGVLSSDGRLTCPWHGACFNVSSGDVEDAPALDPIAKFPIHERDGAVFIEGDEKTIKNSRAALKTSCANPSQQEKVVVVGGGSAATGAVLELRKQGFTGTVTVLGDESNALYDRTKLSKAYITDPAAVRWYAPEFYKDASINVNHDSVTSIDFADKTVHTESGSSEAYTKLILASGGTPKYLPLPGLRAGELQNVYVVRNLDHTNAIMSALGEQSKKVVIVGSSFIGMESANCLAGKKHDVTVIGMEQEPCEAVFGTKVGSIFRALLEKNGVKFQMSATVDKATPASSNPSSAGAVHLKDGATLPADVVILGVGVAPATTYLQGSKGGPSLLKDGSVETNEYFEVKDVSDVYAVGDIATYPYKGAKVRIEHWNVAQNAGRTAAKHIAGTKGIKPFVPVFWSALGAQLRYCGNTTPSGGYDDVIIQGETDVSKGVSWAAFYCKGEEVIAVASMMKDPIMVKSSELMRRGRMVKKSDITGGVDRLLEAKL